MNGAACRGRTVAFIFMILVKPSAKRALICIGIRCFLDVFHWKLNEGLRSEEAERLHPCSNHNTSQCNVKVNSKQTFHNENRNGRASNVVIATQ